MSGSHRYVKERRQKRAFDYEKFWRIMRYIGVGLAIALVFVWDGFCFWVIFK